MSKKISAGTAYEHYGHDALIYSCSNCGAAWCVRCSKRCTVCHFDTMSTSREIWPKRKDLLNKGE